MKRARSQSNNDDDDEDDDDDDDCMRPSQKELKMDDDEPDKKERKEGNRVTRTIEVNDDDKPPSKVPPRTSPTLQDRVLQDNNTVGQNNGQISSSISFPLRGKSKSKQNQINFPKIKLTSIVSNPKSNNGQIFATQCPTILNTLRPPENSCNKVEVPHSAQTNKD